MLTAPLAVQEIVDTSATVLDGTERMGSGRLTAWRINRRLWIEVPADAMWPPVMDPRSDETQSAYILISPEVIEWYFLYYYSVFGTVDPVVASLPLSTEKRGALEAYGFDRADI